MSNKSSTPDIINFASAVLASIVILTAGFMTANHKEPVPLESTRVETVLTEKNHAEKAYRAALSKAISEVGCPYAGLEGRHFKFKDYQRLVDGTSPSVAEAVFEVIDCNGNTLVKNVRTDTEHIYTSSTPIDGFILLPNK